MQNKKWKQFHKLTGKCYLNMIEAEKDGNCWLQAFGTREHRGSYRRSICIYRYKRI